MSSVIDFNSKKKNQDELNQRIKTAELRCPCRNNTFTLSLNRSPEQTKFILQCTNCSQAFDVTQLLAEMLDTNQSEQGKKVCPIL